MRGATLHTPLKGLALPSARPRPQIARASTYSHHTHHPNTHTAVSAAPDADAGARALSALPTRSRRRSSSCPRVPGPRLLHTGTTRKASTVPVSQYGSLGSPSAGPPPPPPPPAGLFEPGSILKGYSGREYTIKNVLQDRTDRHVYLAQTNESEKLFVLKSLFQNEYNYALPLQLRFGSNPYLRALRDTVPDHKMFVNEYMTDHLLNFAFKDVSLGVQKRILRDALRGLASLHQQNIVHLDVKANNIMIDYHEASDGSIEVDRVQLSDLEDSTHVPPGQALSGLQVGNQFWRSPEAHVLGAVGKPSDIFSLAVVFIFFRLRSVIFWVDGKTISDPTMHILERQVSHFGDWSALEGLLDYIGRRHPYTAKLKGIKDSFGEDNPRRPFSLWKSDMLDSEFKDLIAKMTNLDPRKRITARQALEHPWFSDVAEA